MLKKISKNEFGKTATESVYKFKILTPTYRTWWAITIYIILFFGNSFLLHFQAHPLCFLKQRGVI